MLLPEEILPPMENSLKSTVLFFCFLMLLNLLSRGVVKLWKPKVTPMSELAPEGGVNLPAASATAGDSDAYIQKTSLAADKPV